MLFLFAWMVPAFAGDLVDDGYGVDPTAPVRYALEDVAPYPAHDRSPHVGIGLRFRSLSVPRAIVDRWYIDANSEDWVGPGERPHLSGIGVGLEALIRGKASNGRFYAEYVDSSMEPGYWDDADGTADPLDGRYIEPSGAFGLVGVGANYGYELRVVDLHQTAGTFGLSVVGWGGLGLGFLVGRVDQWSSDELGNPAYDRFLEGRAADAENRLPTFVPLIDLSAALRLNFGDRLLWELEGGLHSSVFAGTSLGVVF